MVREENFNRPWYLFAKELLPKDITGKRIVELGGGAGEFASLLVRRGCRVVFTDIDKTNVNRAEACGFTAYKLDLNGGLPFFSDESFDGTIMLEVVEHVFEAEQLFREIHRILRSKGFLLLSTPNTAHIYRRLKALRGHPPKGEGYHVRFFTLPKLLALLSDNGFQIDATNHSTSTFGVNLFRKLSGKSPTAFRFPRFLQPLFVRNIVIRAKRI